MRISDWSSDVCSSDLGGLFGDEGIVIAAVDHGIGFQHRFGKLLDEQRDAVGALGDGVDQLLRQRLLLGEIADDGLALRALQAAEVESCRRKEVAQLRFCLGAQGEGEQDRQAADRSEEHTSELQSLMRISYDVFCLKKKKD